MTIRSRHWIDDVTHHILQFVSSVMNTIFIGGTKQLALVRGKN